jgi:hypothetical protein
MLILCKLAIKQSLYKNRYCVSTFDLEILKENIFYYKETSEVFRSLPPGYKEGKPNLIICPSGNLTYTFD